MTTAAVNYAKVLYELSVSWDSVESTKKLLREAPEFIAVLKNPLVSFRDKERAVDRILPEEMQSFVKTVCRHHRAEGILTAVLRYVTPPEEEQLENIRKFLCGRFHAQRADIELTEDKDLIGGFILQAEGQEYDWSLRGRCRRLEQKLTRR